MISSPSPSSLPQMRPRPRAAALPPRRPARPYSLCQPRLPAARPGSPPLLCCGSRRFRPRKPFRPPAPPPYAILSPRPSKTAQRRTPACFFRRSYFADLRLAWPQLPVCLWAAQAACHRHRNPPMPKPSRPPSRARHRRRHVRPAPLELIGCAEGVRNRLRPCALPGFCVVRRCCVSRRPRLPQLTHIASLHPA